ncbi:hypothetical protein VT84_11970 [Gemmata sp. SH-PL17]|nr:hypothetical protein VT84_11970 [Gemmata sp. SH-PL17]
MARVELTFPLPPDECTARLTAGTNRSYRMFFEDEPKAVYGRVESGRVRLWKRIDFTNPFQMCLSGTFEARGPVTVFRGRIGRDVSSWGPLAVFAVSVLANLYAQVVIAINDSSRISRWLLLALLFATVVGAFRLWRDWRQARDESAFLVEFLRRTLGGTVCDNESGVETMSPQSA